jgi:dihydroorotate dehydrogenase
LPDHQALINRMGFPNQGMEALAARLRQPALTNRHWVVGLSMGKQKETPLAEAVRDYLAVMEIGCTLADYLVVNVSSPNTPGLRDLQRPDYLDEMLRHLQRRNEELALRDGVPQRPLLLKVSPDLDWRQLEEVIASAERNGIAGLVATNTTLSRTGVTGSVAQEEGGLSGRPLAARSTEVVAFIKRSGSRLPIVAAGGVLAADDVRQKLDAGASLVQVYTGLVYEGPGMAGRILRDLVSWPYLGPGVTAL